MIFVPVIAPGSVKGVRWSLPLSNAARASFAVFRSLSSVADLACKYKRRAFPPGHFYHPMQLGLRLQFSDHVRGKEYVILMFGAPTTFCLGNHLT